MISYFHGNKYIIGFVFFSSLLYATIEKSSFFKLVGFKFSENFEQCQATKFGIFHKNIYPIWCCTDCITWTTWSATCHWACLWCITWIRGQPGNEQICSKCLHVPNRMISIEWYFRLSWRKDGEDMWNKVVLNYLHWVSALPINLYEGLLL